MPSREDDTAARLAATLAALAKEQAAHRATLDRLAQAEASARAWRRVARWVWEAGRDLCADD